LRNGTNRKRGQKFVKSEYLKTEIQNISQFIDKQTYEQIFRQHYSELCSYANNFMDDLDDAEEIVQDVFVKIWENRSEINITDSTRAYLFRSVRNTCLNKKKHIKIREEYKAENEREIESNFVDLNAVINASELEIKIRNAIDKLPTERRKIFIMSRYDELKYKEIAEKLNISIKTVENQMGSALKFLRTELIDYITIFILIFLNYK